ESESVLLAGLLVHGAEVDLFGRGTVPLVSVLDGDEGGRIITSVSVAADGVGAVAATGRTPADIPIVAAVARSAGGKVRVALTGVASAPVEVDATDPAKGLSPPGDFRGSSAYRLHLATVLCGRVVAVVSS
ncbi:MAG: hypothetical protein ACC660_05335, partial [Acidimicrobiales bacterium]